MGFAIKMSLVPKLLGKPKAINDHLMSVRLPLTKNHCATLISVYAPTMQYPDEDKNKFYSQLRIALSNSMCPQDALPGGPICTDTGIEIAKDDELVLSGHARSSELRI